MGCTPHPKQNGDGFGKATAWIENLRTDLQRCKIRRGKETLQSGRVVETNRGDPFETRVERCLQTNHESAQLHTSFDRGMCRRHGAGSIQKSTVSNPKEKNKMVSTAMKICPHCSKDIPVEDAYCSYCGEEIKVLSSEDQKKVKKAANWILALSILFIIFGTIVGFKQLSEAEKAKENLSQYEDSLLIDKPLNGNRYTVGELKAIIDHEVILVFLTNYFLAVVMLGLYLWARKSPFPAMITALCVYLAVIVLNAIISPLTIFQGVVIKIIFITALIAGIKTSLSTRKVANI
jgi:predicted nucleic acid-binding Zn ribbon protein